MPQAKSQESEVFFGKKTCLAQGLYLIELQCQDLAKKIVPGEFFNLKVPGDATEILRLPFSYVASFPDSGIVELMYQELGKGTRRITQQDFGSRSTLLGPLGQGFSTLRQIQEKTQFCPELKKDKRVLLVAGGVGMAPLMPLAQRLAAEGCHFDFVLGASSKDRAVLFDRLRTYGASRIFLSTDDGSAGYHGFCTEVSAALMKEAEGLELSESERSCLQNALIFDAKTKSLQEYLAVYTCGPEPMQKKIAELAEKHKLYCEVSLERGMICGIGACMSCVVELKDGKKPCVCTRGPVFDASEVNWNV